MGSLADHIEAYLKRLLDEAEQGMIEVRRSDLAGLFSCVPSQITYVLETRFTPGRGYLVESRRGGGGFIRIVRYGMPQASPSAVLQEVVRRVGRSLPEATAFDLIGFLEEAGLLDSREGMVFRSLLRREAAPWPAESRDVARALLFKGMLIGRFGRLP